MRTAQKHFMNCLKRNFLICSWSFRRYASKSLEYRVPKLSFVSVPLDLRLMKIEQSTDTKMPYVIIILNPLKTRQRITIPIDTSRHFT